MDNEDIARTKRSFRSANDTLAERFREIAPTGFSESGLAPFICECADARCTQVIQLGLDEYDGVRASGGLVVVPGHERFGGDRVVELGSRYAVIEGDGTAQGTLTFGNS